MVRLSVVGSLMILMLIATTVLGCGVMLPGQERNRGFTVTGFKLPVSMVAYIGSGSIPIEVPGIATSKAAAKGFIDRLVMQTVFDVLEQQGRSAFLPDTIISAILGQLRIQINYDPLECKAATEIKNAQTMIMRMNMVAPHCIIVSGTVTALCGTIDTNNEVNCMMPTTLKDTAAIPVNYTTFSGTFTTTNIVMANWPREMWQGVVNRAVRMLASSPFATHFVSASATVS